MWLILEEPLLESRWEPLFSVFLFVRSSPGGSNILVPQTDADAVHFCDTFGRKTYHFSAELQTNAISAGGDHTGLGHLECWPRIVHLEQTYCLHVWLPSKFIFRIQNFQWNYWTGWKGARLTHTSSFLQRKCSTSRGKMTRLERKHNLHSQKVCKFLRKGCSIDSLSLGNRRNTHRSHHFNFVTRPHNGKEWWLLNWVWPEPLVACDVFEIETLHWAYKDTKRYKGDWCGVGRANRSYARDMSMIATNLIKHCWM